MHPHLQALATQRGGVFTRADALSVGYSAADVRARVTSGRWFVLRRGVYAAELGARSRLAAALAVLPPTAVLSHRSAAALHGWPLLGGDRPTVDITAPGSSTRRTRTLIVHAASLEGRDRVQVQALAATSPARTVVDVARSVPFREAVVVADAALAGRLVTQRELTRCLIACFTWPGIRRAHRVLAFADPSAESPGESLSRVAIAAAGLPMPRAQAWVGSVTEVIGRVDFLWEAERTVGEFDGRLKYTDPAALWAEKLREDRLRDAGFEVVRWTWTDVHGDFTRAAGRIRAAFARAARQK